MTASTAGPGTRVHRPVLTREQKWEQRFEIPTVAAALLVIPTIVIEESGLVGGWQVLATALNWAIWGVFALQVATMLLITQHRRRWIGRHILELLIVVLTPPFLPPSLQSTRVLRLLRLFRVVLTARALRAFFSLNGLKFATVVALFGVLGAGALFATVETGQHLSTWDGVWWAVNQITTAGSEIIPHTTGGRVVAIGVLLVGVGYIAILTGAMAQLFIRAMHVDSDPNRDLVNRLDGLTSDVASLRDEIRQLIKDAPSR